MLLTLVSRAKVHLTKIQDQLLKERRTKGLTGVEMTSVHLSFGPSPLWLRKECVTAGHRMKSENVSHEFPATFHLLYVVAWSLFYWLADLSHLWLCYCFWITALDLSWLTNALKFLSSNPIVDLNRVHCKSCLKQAEFHDSAKAFC